MSQDIKTPSKASGRSRVAGPAADDPLAAGAEFERLAQRISELPAFMEPERDLWAGVEAGLSPRRKAGAPWRRSAPVRYWTQALAAALGVAVGVAVTWLAMSGTVLSGTVLSGTSLPGTDGASASNEAADREAVRLASSASLDGVESQLLRAKEELWLVAFERRDELSPEAWGVVQQNLQILDSAISNLRSALAEDPGNAEIQQRLLRNQRRSLDLLRAVTSDLTSEPADDSDSV